VLRPPIDTAARIGTTRLALDWGNHGAESRVLTSLGRAGV